MADTTPKTLSAKLPMDVVEAARIVAAYRNEQIGDLLGGILRPILAKMEQEEQAKRTKAREGKATPPISNIDLEEQTKRNKAKGAR
jgi:hypothetical protein